MSLVESENRALKYTSPHEFLRNPKPPKSRGASFLSLVTEGENPGDSIEPLLTIVPRSTGFHGPYVMLGKPPYNDVFGRNPYIDSSSTRKRIHRGRQRSALTSLKSGLITAQGISHWSWKQYSSGTQIRGNTWKNALM